MPGLRTWKLIAADVGTELAEHLMLLLGHRARDARQRSENPGQVTAGTITSPLHRRGTSKARI